jgi:hypothetical protein
VFPLLLFSEFLIEALYGASETLIYYILHLLVHYSDHSSFQHHIVFGVEEHMKIFNQIFSSENFSLQKKSLICLEKLASFPRVSSLISLDNMMTIACKLLQHNEKSKGIILGISES